MNMSIRRASILSVVLVSTLFAANASADEEQPPAPAAAPAPASAYASADKPAKETNWYGYQTLFSDGAALGVGMLAPKGGIGFAYAGLATYAIGAPIIHLAHGSGGKALGDLALRVGTPFGAAFVGGIAFAATAPAGTDGIAGLGRIMVGMAYGAVAGVGIAIGIDAIVLAREDVPAAKAADVAHAAPRPAPAQHASIVPTFAPTPGGATAGVAGTF